MKAAQMTIDDIKTKLTPLLDARGVTKAILFGSYAKQTATHTSDIDLVVDLPKEKRGFNFYGLYGDLTTAIGTDIDLIPMIDIETNGKLDHEIKQQGVIIYER